MTCSKIARFSSSLSFAGFNQIACCSFGFILSSQIISNNTSAKTARYLSLSASDGISGELRILSYIHEIMDRTLNSRLNASFTYRLFNTSIMLGGISKGASPDLICLAHSIQVFQYSSAELGEGSSVGGASFSPLSSASPFSSGTDCVEYLCFTGT